MTDLSDLEVDLVHLIGGSSDDSHHDPSNLRAGVSYDVYLATEAAAAPSISTVSRRGGGGVHTHHRSRRGSGADSDGSADDEGTSNPDVSGSGDDAGAGAGAGASRAASRSSTRGGRKGTVVTVTASSNGHGHGHGHQHDWSPSFVFGEDVVTSSNVVCGVRTHPAPPVVLAHAARATDGSR